MGNFVSNIDIMADKNKISELEFDNKELQIQINGLKQIIQKDGDTISNLEKEIKDLKNKNQCVICEFINNRTTQN